MTYKEAKEEIKRALESENFNVTEYAGGLDFSLSGIGVNCVVARISKKEIEHYAN